MKNFNSIFIVDDDLVYHFIMKKLFAKTELNVTTTYFFNGLQAIEEIKQNKTVPDLILLDINMPICDGWQFLEEFKTIKQSLTKNVLVYLVSSSNDIADTSKCEQFKNEVQKYLNKPMTFDNFKSIFPSLA